MFQPYSEFHGQWKRRYKHGNLLQLLRSGKSFESFVTRSLSCPVPRSVLNTITTTYEAAPLFNSLGAQYLCRYLLMIKQTPRFTFKNIDFTIFAITLRKALTVLRATLERYLIQAWKALSMAGWKLSHPKLTGCLTLIKGMGVGENITTKPKRAYCSIRWEAILAWKENLPQLSRLDKIALTIVALAFTTIRRLGSFVPSTLKKAQKFPQITPQNIRFRDCNNTLFI